MGWVVNRCLQLFIKSHYVVVSELLQNRFFIRSFLDVRSITTLQVPVDTLHCNQLPRQLVQSKIYFAKCTTTNDLSALIVLRICERWFLCSLEWYTNLLFDLVYFNSMFTLLLIVVSILRLLFHLIPYIFDLVEFLLFHFFDMCGKMCINLFSFSTAFYSFYPWLSEMMKEVVTNRYVGFAFSLFGLLAWLEVLTSVLTVEVVFEVWATDLTWVLTYYRYQ